MKLSKEFIARFREEARRARWEINRWNGKSIDDLVIDYLERKELKPEDFKDVVVLTVKEASAIKERLSDLMLVAGSDRYRKVVQRSLDAIISSLNQIAQAEVQDEDDNR